MPPSSFQELPKSVRMVLVDVFDNPGTPIGAIAERTGFPQSLVSAAVARLRDAGILRTERDESDRRRTLVHPAPDAATWAREARSTMPPVDDTIAAVLAERLGTAGAAELAEALAALETLGRLLGGANEPHEAVTSC